MRRPLNAIRMRLIFIDLEPILCHDDNYREHVKMSSTATFSLLLCHSLSFQEFLQLLMNEKLSSCLSYE